MTLNAPSLHPPRRARARRRWARPTQAAVTTGAFVLGALTEYFLDPRAGRRRRRTARDRTFATIRRTEHRAAVRARRAESRATGNVRRILARRRHREPLDDVMLAQKVQSELFGRAQVPKGHIDVNAEDGVVFLRGVVDREEDIPRIGEAARAIDGVRDVENLLHVPGTPAPASRPKFLREGRTS
jgi:BON domain